MVFLNFFHWFEDATVDMKLKIIFAFLNNGDDLKEEIIKKILKKFSKKTSEV
jgi:hypothetical protein